MNRTSKELKRLARQNLVGNYQTPMGVYVIANLLLLLAGLPFSRLNTVYASVGQQVLVFAGEILISLVAVVLHVGQLRVHLCLARKQNCQTGQLFWYFKDHPDRYIIAGFFTLLATGVCMIPEMVGLYCAIDNPTAQTIVLAVVLFVVSLVLSLWLVTKLALWYYVLMEQPQLSVKDAFLTAIGLMKGQMGRYLYLLLSFLGMWLLVILSLGIGVLWIAPYQMQTETMFFLDVTGELDSVSNKQKEEFIYE